MFVAGLRAQLDNSSQTSDEAVHLAAGQRELLGRSRINHEHPPLAKLVAALPVRSSGAQLPEDAAGGEPAQLQQAEALLEERAAQWAYGLTFFYQTPSNDPQQMLRQGRGALALLTALKAAVEAQ